MHDRQLDLLTVSGLHEYFESFTVGATTTKKMNSNIIKFSVQQSFPVATHQVPFIGIVVWYLLSEYVNLLGYREYIVVWSVSHSHYSAYLSFMLWPDTRSRDAISEHQNLVRPTKSVNVSNTTHSLLQQWNEVKSQLDMSKFWQL